LKIKDNKVGNSLFCLLIQSLVMAMGCIVGCMQQSESFIKADKSSDLIPWSAVTIDMAFLTYVRKGMRR
jgi:hypothetical protein